MKPSHPIDFHSKIVSSTGANGGLGYECTHLLLIAIVILACRTLSKGEGARQKLLVDPLADKGNLEA